MRRLISPLLALTLITAGASAALAQADAAEAMEQARKAYQAGDFTAARDLAAKAAETDPNNPEVHLLLGQARYQLGELDQAMAAWTRTLKLAPEQPYAKRMLDVLRGQAAEVDVRIKLIDAMIRQRLHASAVAECTKLLAEKAPSDAQRARVMTLRAESLVRMHKGPDARNVLHELLTLYPQQADPVQTTLLLGEAKLQGDEQSTAEALVLLRKLIADHPQTAAAARAQYDVITHDPALAGAAARAEGMEKWLAAHGDHELADDARRGLVDTYLAVTREGPKPTAESDLGPHDVKALALAGQIYGQFLPAGKADALTNRLLGHLDAHYTKNGAHAAAVRAMESLLAAPLPPANRLAVLKALGSAKYMIAADWLDEMARAGQLPVVAPRGKLPEKLADVLAVFQTIRTEFPAEDSWTDQANLAKRIRTSSSRVLPTAGFAGLSGPDAWALDVALPVVSASKVDADGNQAAVKSAVETVLAVIQERAKVNKPASRMLAVSLSAELLGAVSDEHPSWAAVIVSYYTVVQNYAPYAFQENIKAGRAEENAKLSEVQKAYLTTLKNHLATEARQAPHALVQLAQHVKPWVEHGHWAVAEQAYAMVVDALPETQRRQADLAVVNLWIQQVTREHQRLTAAGLTVPRELDETLNKALLRCYQLQAGLEQEPVTLAQVRGVWDSIVAHYKALEYYQTAQAAIRVKGEQAVGEADEYAALQLVVLSDEQARRGLARSLKQYGASEKIALGPEFEKVIAAYTKFIADRPTSSLVAHVTDKVFAIGRLFQQHGAHSTAAGVYGTLARSAAEVQVLSESAPGSSSTAERAAYAVAGALDAEARKVLQKTLADRQSDEPPPAKLSGQFAAAIGAYKAFIAAHPDSPLLADATAKVMAVALEYAKIDAWDVADAVYADLLAAKLEIRRPERLQFARGLCQLGRAMPEHARQVLTALSAGGLRGTGAPSGPPMVAMTDGRTTAVGGGIGGMGMGAMGADSSSGPAPVEAPAAQPDVATPPQPAATQPVQVLSESSAEADRDVQLLAMIRRQESSRAAQVAQLRDNFAVNALVQQSEQQADQQGQAQQPARQGQQAKVVPVLSEAELSRQATAIQAAYKIFQAIHKGHPHTPTAAQARGEILVMVGHWRSLGQWERSAVLAVQFLADNPTDAELPKLRLEVARDRLAWAARPIQQTMTKQQRLAQVLKRFDAARAEFAAIVAELAGERSAQHQAQWEIAGSFLKQARVVGSFGPTLARGQYVRAAKELRGVAESHPGHPRLGEIPQTLWNISTELEGRGYNEEAILVLNELKIHDPMHGLAQQAAMKIANTYHQKLKRPLRAAEAYQELYFAGGGGNQSLLDAIFQIGSELKGQKRWVEALHVLETFVDSFPKHPKAGQALTMVGQIHQTNEAWKDAIAAYRRVIDEFTNGQFVQESKWAIAECTINLSQWSQAADAYRDYVAAYAKDAKVAEAKRRIDVLKDLARFQGLVDKQGQRKAFDAQYQIGRIVAEELSNRVKAIIEYRKVVANWPASHLADDALFEIGRTYLALQETENAREALLLVAQKYPSSPLADDALFEVGKSFEDEATRLASVTRDVTLARNKDEAQRRAYLGARYNFSRQQDIKNRKIADLKAAGKGKVAAAAEAAFAANTGQFNDANVRLFAQKAAQEVETLTATQLADRQDKINSALRRAVEVYTRTSKVAGADKADDALLQMATIYDQRLKDSQAAMNTWLEIVRQFSGTDVAENASWRIAETYQREGQHAKAIDAYKAYLRNYRSGPKAGDAQFAIAENYEHLGEWVSAMDAYTNYITNFPQGPLLDKAKSQIAWIKTYWL